MSSIQPESKPTPQNRNTNLTKSIIQRGVQILVVWLVYGLLLFVSAGRLNWLAAWIYLAIYIIDVLINMAFLLLKNPEFIAERGKVKQDTKGWDKGITGLIGIFMITGLVIPGLDLRFGWSASFPIWLQIAGFLAIFLGYALFSWAMLSNEFFERTVRIQKDRRQSVVSAGPYRYVRHPGYAGMILELLATPLALGSWWGIIPALGSVGGFIFRTTLEDNTLKGELEGYQDYAEKVRYLLLPGVW